MPKRILCFLALLVLDAVLVWRPFDSRAVGYDSGSRSNQSAGEIVQGFHLTQTVPADLFQIKLPRRPITHWHRSRARLYQRNPNCFAIMFATNLRTNAGHIAVDWHQGPHQQQWRFNAAGLRDNSFVDFCPAAGLDAAQPFQFEVNGVDSIEGRAATLWLTKSSPSPVLINGKPASGGRGAVLQLTRVHRVGPGEILRLDKGAFAFACVCSLGIGALVLLLAWRRRNHRAAGIGPTES